MAADDLASANTELERLRAEVTQLSADLGASRQREAALQSQVTATADVLRVVASSPTQLTEVLNTLTSTAARLCGAEHAVVQVPDGDVLRVVANVFTTEDAARH